jgi:hypothetical protein
MEIVKILPVKQTENTEAQEILKIRRKQDRTQSGQVRSVTKKGALTHLREQNTTNVLQEPSSSALHIYGDLFGDDKTIRGEYVRGSKIKDLNLIEGIHDE